MFHSHIFPGMVVDINFYDTNPTIHEDLREHFHNGYIEATLTVTEDNLSVCTTCKKILFVRPVTHKEGIITVLGDFTYFAITKDATVSSVAFGSKRVETEHGPKELDVVLFSFGTEEDTFLFVPVAFEHNKEAWLDSAISSASRGNAAS